MPILYFSRIFQNIASEDKTFFFKIILKFNSKNFIWLRKTWLLFLHPNNRRVLTISTANHWTIFMSNFRINWVEKNEKTLPWKFCNFTRLKLCGIFASLVLEKNSAKWTTAKISVYWISDVIYLTKHRTNDDDNFHITAILKWNINIATTLHLLCFDVPAIF